MFLQQCNASFAIFKVNVVVSCRYSIDSILYCPFAVEQLSTLCHGQTIRTTQYKLSPQVNVVYLSFSVATI